MVFGDDEMIEVEKITGIGGYGEEKWKDGEEDNWIYVTEENGKVFLVVRTKTIEVRCERNLSQKLREEYETVMESRYFGRGGIEIVMCGQLEEGEIEDLIRLSYNLTVAE